jgi:hypothetical protein
MGLYVEFGWEMAVWEPKEKNTIKKTLNTGGSEFELNSRANRQLIKKPRRVIFCYIVLNQNPKFEVCRFENGDNTRLRETDGKT